MLPINERLSRRDATVFVAMDTVGPLVEHVIGLLGDGREMVKLRRYRHNVPANADAREREDRGLSGLDIKTGLRISNQDDYRVPVIDHWTRTDPRGEGLTVYLGRSLSDGFSFGAYAHESAETEEQVREAYWRHEPGDVFSRRRNLTVVRVDGWPGEPSRDDRIEIEHWNDHGVCEDIIIAFTGPTW